MYIEHAFWGFWEKAISLIRSITWNPWKVAISVWPHIVLSDVVQRERLCLDWTQTDAMHSTGSNNGGTQGQSASNRKWNPSKICLPAHSEGQMSLFW